MELKSRFLNTTALSRQRCGFSRKLCGSASHFQSGLCWKTAKKCLQSKPVRLKSGQLHFGILSSQPKESLYHVSFDSGDLP